MYEHKKNGSDEKTVARLCQAIIVQAADDYRRALKVLKHESRDWKSLQIWKDALHTKREVENFFHSQWYQMLTEVDGDYLITRLQSDAKFTAEDKNMDDMYHACRWCRSYANGKCCQGIADPDWSAVDWVFNVAESGQLSEVLEETLGSVDRKTFKDALRIKLLEWKISGKRIEEFTELFDDCMDQFIDVQFKPVCNENISRLYQNIPELKSEGVTIKDPENFYCKYFE